MPAQLLVGLEEVRSKWGWYLIFGIVLIAIGVMAIGQAFVASLASMSLLGWLVIVSGLVQALLAFRVRNWCGFFSAPARWRARNRGRFLDCRCAVECSNCTNAVVSGLPTCRRLVSHDRDAIYSFPRFWMGSARRADLFLVGIGSVAAMANIRSGVCWNVRWCRAHFARSIMDCFCVGYTQASKAHYDLGLLKKNS